MCSRSLTDEEEEQIFKKLHERFPTEWDINISWGHPTFDTLSHFELTIPKTQLRAIIGSRCDCDNCNQIQ